MVSRPRSWWQKIRKPLAIAGIILISVLGIALIVGIIGGYLLNWDWSGLNAHKEISTATEITLSPQKKVTTTTLNQSGKTLWDWLQLLIIPAVIAVGGYLFNLAVSRNERMIVADNQREAALQAYIDKMSELLLEKKLRESQPGDEVRMIARVRTLTVVRGLDAKRKGTVLRFVQESNLIERADPIIELGRANLSGADLRYFSLTGVSLVHANLWRADLRYARLEGDFREASFDDADLRYATIEGANLRYATLIHADLSEATLIQTNLEGADLSGANLSGVDLRNIHLEGASLKGAANVNIEQSNEAAYFLQNMIMPDGSKHP